MKALVDNDVLLKAVCYGLLHELISSNGTSCGVLGAAQFVLAKRIRRLALRGDVVAAQSRLDGFISQALVVEPTDEEQDLAADLEGAAQRAGVSLDSGESQLCAILVSRMVPWLLTGDKRAICAIEVLLELEPRISSASGKVRCLEQLVLAAISRGDINMLRSAICSEPAIDKTLTICFSCRSSSVARESILEGLESYISSLRCDGPRVLATS